MADDRADAAQVLLGLLIDGIEGLLKDGRREGDVVGAGVEAGVDHVAGHQPFGAVHALRELVEIVLQVDGVELQHDGQQGVVFVEDQGGEDRPDLVGITHLDLHGGELFDGLLLGGFGQEGVLPHPVLIGLDDLFDHGDHVLLGLLAEVGPAVVDADGLGIHLGGDLIGLLFQAGVGFDALQGPGIGLAQGGQLLGEAGRGLQQGGDVSPVQVEGQLLLGEVTVHLLQGSGIVDDQGLRRLLAVQLGQELFHVEGRGVPGDLVHGHGVVALDVVRPLQHALDLLGNQGVEGQGVVEILLPLRLGQGREGQDLGCHVGVEGQQLFPGLVVLGVVGGVRQDELGTGEDEGIPFGVPHVLGDAHPQGELHAHQHQLRGVGVEILHGFDSPDLLQEGQGGSNALAVPALGVQDLLVEGHGVFHLRDVGGLFPGGKGPEFLHHQLFHGLVQVGKAAGGGSVLGDDGGFEPLPVDRHVEIVLNSDVCAAHD